MSMKTRQHCDGKGKVTGTDTCCSSHDSVPLWGPEARARLEFSALKAAQELTFAMHCKVRRKSTSWSYEKTLEVVPKPQPALGRNQDTAYHELCS